MRTIEAWRMNVSLSITHARPTSALARRPGLKRSSEQTPPLYRRVVRSQPPCCVPLVSSPRVRKVASKSDVGAPSAAQCPRFRARALGCRRTPFFFPLHGLIDENTLLHHGLIDENTRSGRLIGTLHVSIDQSINRVRTPFHSMHFNSIPFHSMRLPRRKNSKGEIIDHGKGVNLENVDRVKMLIGGTCLCLCPE